ncbi:cobalamin-independent methionine synthase II family protein [Pseudoneobacillus rhizosphaerae]|uniref:5-methyltetrahydropteroyltriglutamate--homocysteine methyltransferase n=1 Tax=Pseudoneobacillus rhizosphaerae TaxID=2880968 RepID=A0A9C7GAT4_9BACI|nr:cobalamin-independent methionine synthase II family protein [Pseudoneobacillus rhizosphaerae]CAG9609044.1 5-methyltetrahydropteroyltriglutamate--homocysteine methyltransferase [Pseudoneobacillus rhizosphaerae]
MTLPTFPTTVIGSWPRSKEVQRAMRDKRSGRITEEEFQAVADNAILKCLQWQEEAGIDIVSDGEQRRDNFISFVAEHLNNVRMLMVSELLDYVEDKASFEEILGTLDVPAFSMSNPAATGKISRKKPLALNDFLFLKKHTSKAIKVALPGPYLLTRAMWVEGLSKDAYPTKEDLSIDIIKVLREELEELIQAGVDFVQFDEPVLTELVFTQKNANRTFMCGALTAKADAEEEIAFALELMNQVTNGLLGNGTRIGVHICRGNWSKQEQVLLRGPYYPLIPYLSNVNVDQLILEYATPRAGELDAIGDFGGKEIGFGIVNPRTEKVETLEEIVSRLEEVRTYLPDTKIFLNPDCGFGTFAQRPMNSDEIAFEKLKVMSEAAKRLREMALTK